MSSLEILASIVSQLADHTAVAELQLSSWLMLHVPKANVSLTPCLTQPICSTALQHSCAPAAVVKRQLSKDCKFALFKHDKKLKGDRWKVSSCCGRWLHLPCRI